MSRSNEYETYIKSPAWRFTAKKVKEHFGYVCKRCGHAGWDVEVHHLNYDRLGREWLSDLEVLCKACHKKADQERALANAVDHEELREDAAYQTYMRKKYGEEWWDRDSVEMREEFDEWLQRKQETAWEDYESPNFEDY